MNTQRGFITACLLLAAAGGGHAQSSNSAAQKEIERAYVRTSKAMQHKDMGPLFAVMTADATFKEADGSLISRSTMEGMMKQMFATASYSEVKSTVTKWVWKGNTALLDVTLTSAGKVKMPDGKTHAVTYLSKSRDHWVKQADGWRLQQIVAVSEAMTQDGKAVRFPPPLKH